MLFHRKKWHKSGTNFNSEIRIDEKGLVMDDTLKKQEVEWHKAAKGIRYRLHPTRKHGKQPDRYYVIRYTVDGQKKQEALGWLSEGWTLDKVQEQLSILKAGFRTGEGPQSLAEKRQVAKDARKAAEAAKEKEQQRLITVGDFFEQHFLPYAKRTKKQGSWRVEHSHYIHWIKPIVGNLPVVEVGFPQWEALLKSMDKAQLAQRTKEYITGTLRRILRHAQDRDVEVKIPTSRQIGATAPKDNRRLRVLTPKETEEMLSELEKRNIHAWRMTKFAMLTGCRLSEVCDLRWRDVNLEEKQLRFVDTKNKDTRIIFLSPALVDLLAGFGPGRPEEIVFPRVDGEQHTDAPYTFRTVIERLGLNIGRSPRDRVSFHTIRHTVATQLARSLDVRSLMDIMGWKTVQMAARYIHSNEDTKRAAMAALEKTLAPQDTAKILPFAGKSKNA